MIKQAVKLLRQGRLVAFPTETVYGLGALPTQKKAIQKLFAVKNRSLKKPCSLLIPDQTHIRYWAQNINSAIVTLANAFWPGPLTLLLHPSKIIANSFFGDFARIGLRVPAHPTALALLNELDGALMVSSANISGKLSTTTAEAVQQQLGDVVSLILEGEDCKIGVESTVLDMGGEVPILVRQGAISMQSLEHVLQQKIESHVACGVINKTPNIRIQWLDHGREDNLIAETASRIAVLVYQYPIHIYLSKAIYVQMPNDPTAYQQALYKQLNQLQARDFEVVFVQRLPRDEEWRVLSTCLNQWCQMKTDD